MHEHDVIAVLAEHWQDVLPYFSPDDLTFLAGLISKIDAAAQDQEAARAALADLMTMLAVRLPRRHPVRQAMSQETRYAELRSVMSRADLSRVASALLALPGLEPLLRPPPAGHPGAADAEDPYAWLLSAPALTEREVRDVGGDPERADLIRLPGADSAVVLPAFQFGPDGQPVPVVAEINLLLQVTEDPWGVADWWLGKNAWLRGIPAELLGRVTDAELVLAARAELPEE